MNPSVSPQGEAGGDEAAAKAPRQITHDRGWPESLMSNTHPPVQTAAAFSTTAPPIGGAGLSPPPQPEPSGSRNVNSSHVKFKARQQDVPGQFGMGEIIELRVLARVDKVEFASKHDGDGNVIETKRIRQLNALSVEQMTEVPDEFAAIDGRMETMKRV